MVRNILALQSHLLKLTWEVPLSLHLSFMIGPHKNIKHWFTCDGVSYSQKKPPAFQNLGVNNFSVHRHSNVPLLPPYTVVPMRGQHLTLCLAPNQAWFLLSLLCPSSELTRRLSLKTHVQTLAGAASGLHLVCVGPRTHP